MRGRSIGAAVVLAFVVAGTLFRPAPLPAATRTVSGKVVRVADGDTLTVVERGRAAVNVRLYGIDAPEVRHEETPGQRFGREARQALRALTLGRRVRVEVVDVDTHGRVVGLVYESGVDVNRAMVAAGWAWAYRRYLAAPYASEFIGAEREARAKRLGIWTDSNPMPPWEFRRRTR